MRALDTLADVAVKTNVTKKLDRFYVAGGSKVRMLHKINPIIYSFFSLLCLLVLLLGFLFSCVCVCVCVVVVVVVVYYYYFFYLFCWWFCLFCLNIFCYAVSTL